MTDKPRYTLSRRTMLGGIGAVGLASAGAGLGTSAYFNDTEAFTGNTIAAGQLDLIVDWHTDIDQGAATPDVHVHEGTMNGNGESYSYEISDVKPGDSGTLVFCPKIVDNPAYLWLGSAGVTDYENGQTEPEAEVDTTGGDPGEGAGELSEAIQVVVSQADSAYVDEETGELVCENAAVLGGLGNLYPASLADLASMLSGGMPVYADYNDTENQVYPASEDATDQQGKCLCIEWEVPTSVGNEIQTDSLEMDFQFIAEQARHNSDGATTNPFAN